MHPVHSVLTIPGPRSGPQPGGPSDNRVSLAAPPSGERVRAGWLAWLGRRVKYALAHVSTNKRGHFTTASPDPTVPGQEGLLVNDREVPRRVRAGLQHSDPVLEGPELAADLPEAYP
jgi:hypothetical protein